MLTARVKRLLSSERDAREACFDNGDDSGRAKRLMKEKLSPRPYQFVSFLFFCLAVFKLSGYPEFNNDDEQRATSFLSALLSSKEQIW